LSRWLLVSSYSSARSLVGAAPWWSSLSTRPIISYAPLYCPLWANMSSTKPEVHNVLHCLQRRIEQRSQVTRVENLVKFDIWFWDMPADRHTLKHTDTIVHTPTGGDVTRMWANAQRDGRPAARSWCPLFNAAKFGWHPLLECRAVTLPRRETRWNLQGCPKLPNRS